MPKRGHRGNGQVWGRGEGKPTKRKYYRARRQMGKLEARTGREDIERGITAALSMMKWKNT